MSQKKIKILSSGLVFLFLIATFILSDNKSSYFAPFSKSDSNTQAPQESEQVKSASISAPVTPAQAKEGGVSNDSMSPSEGAEVYRVVKVVDGDTLDVDMNGTATRIRIIGIDTPETVDPRKPVQCFGKEASNRAKEILSGQFITLIADESQGNTDKYSRLLRYITLPDGSDYGLTMISEGYAHEYTYNIPYEKQADYKRAEIDARNSNSGLWSPSTCNGNK
jgi:micrococcal nuclease